MKSVNYGFKSGEEGKGSTGCIFALFLMVIAIFLAFKLGPPYFSHNEFKSDLNQLASRVASNVSISDENVKKNVKAIAQKNGIVLKDGDIRIDKSVNARIIIEVNYAVPVNFIIMKRDINFHAREEGVVFM